MTLHLPSPRLCVHGSPPSSGIPVRPRLPHRSWHRPADDCSCRDRPDELLDAARAEDFSWISKRGRNIRGHSPFLLRLMIACAVIHEGNRQKRAVAATVVSLTRDERDRRDKGLVYLVYLVCLGCLGCLVRLVCLGYGPREPDRPKKPNEPERRAERARREAGLFGLSG